MKISVNFQDVDFLMERAPVFYELTEGFINIHWENERLPMIGEGIYLEEFIPISKIKPSKKDKTYC